MMRRIAALAGTLPLVLALIAAPARAQEQQGASPIDDLIKRAEDAFNDLNYARADVLAHQVLNLGSSITTTQRTNALLVIAAAAYPEEVAAQKRALALATLKQIVRTNLDLRLPQELTWAGLDSLAAEARRTTFGMAVRADSTQQLVGPSAMAAIRVRGSRAGRYYLTIMPAAGGAAVVADSTAPIDSGEFRFPSMRDSRPVFTTGDYDVIVSGVDAVAADTITVRYVAHVDAPALTFMPVPTKLDSTRLLPEHTKRFGAKSIFPAILVGGAAYALSSSVKGDGGLQTAVTADSKGMAVGGVLMISAIAAGYLDHGRAIPANVAANKAYGEAFQKSIVDTQAENRRRIAEYRTTIRLDLGGR